MTLQGNSGIRVAAAGVGALVLSWLAITTGVAGIARASDPAAVLRLVPNDARALANLADRTLTADADKAQIARASALAREAIRRDPTVVGAVRVLAFVAPKAEQPARFGISNRLSRRDLATQLWLIEAAVAANDGPRALGHFDAALRTSSVAPRILFPILSRATEEPELLPEITRLLARRPSWGTPFLYAAVNDAPSSQNLLAMVEGLKRSGYPVDAAILQNLVKRTIRDNRYDLARKAYVLAGGKSAKVGQTVSNGDFTATPALLPFDWALINSAGIVADRMPMADGNVRFVVRAEGAAGGIAVQQLLLLSPGQYRLETLAGDVPEAARGSIGWRVACAPDYTPQLLNMTLPGRAGRTVRVGSNFSVPANCPAQFLSLVAANAVDTEPFETWVDAVSVSPIGR